MISRNIFRDIYLSIDRERCWAKRFACHFRHSIMSSRVPQSVCCRVKFHTLNGNKFMYFDWQTNVLNTSILFHQYIIIQIVIQKLFIFCKRECHRMFIKHKLLQNLNLAWWHGQWRVSYYAELQKSIGGKVLIVQNAVGCANSENNWQQSRLRSQRFN